MKAAALLTLALAWFTWAAAARAQEATSVAVFRTATAESNLRELAEALDPVVLAELDKVSKIRITARPALDLPATQLALDCVGETATCLRSVAEQAGAEVLIAPSVGRADAETMVTLLYFDARKQGELRTATRRHAGVDVSADALDAVPAMVRELFEIAEQPDPTQAPDVTQPQPVEIEAEPHEPALERPLFPTVPVVITATGVVVLGAGIALGLMANSTEDDYADIDVIDMPDADGAIEEFESAETQALIANVAIGVGVATVAVGAVLWVLELSEEPDAEGAWLAPRLGPGEAGLLLRGRFGGAAP